MPLSTSGLPCLAWEDGMCETVELEAVGLEQWCVEKWTSVPEFLVRPIP